MKVLHLGCGRKGRDLSIDSREPAEIITLDADARLAPEIVCTLGRDPIPLPDNSIDLAVAIHVLEHIGRQGETAEWFFFWEELYRVLTPGGRLEFESPLYSSVWAWGDPSHVRVLSPQALVFFSQDSYRLEGSAISPYRIACDFLPLQTFEGMTDTNPQIAAQEQFSHFRGILTAQKPLRPWWLDDVRPVAPAAFAEAV
jgi:SAM-dependent methyltransferase